MVEIPANVHQQPIVDHYLITYKLLSKVLQRPGSIQTKVYHILFKEINCRIVENSRGQTVQSRT